MVVAAGNASTDARGITPSNCREVITVAAYTRDGSRAWYSNFGSVIILAAPGGDTRSNPADGIVSTLNTGTQAPEQDSYAPYQGTSMAAPHVAGVAALMLAANPNLNPGQVKQILQDTSRPFVKGMGTLCTSNSCGSGMLDADKAVKTAEVTYPQWRSFPDMPNFGPAQ